MTPTKYDEGLGSHRCPLVWQRVCQVHGPASGERRRGDHTKLIDKCHGYSKRMKATMIT